VFLDINTGVYTCIFTDILWTFSISSQCL